MRPTAAAATHAALFALLLGTLASMALAPVFWSHNGPHLAADLLHAAEVLDEEVRHVVRHVVRHTTRALRRRVAVAR